MKILLFGATGQIGSAVTRELLKRGTADTLTLIGRRKAPEFSGRPNVMQVVVDTASPGFQQSVQAAAQGHDAAICCVGIGSGSLRMSPEQIQAIEVDLVAAFAAGCKAAGVEIFEVLTAVGSRESLTRSRIPQMRMLGQKHMAAVQAGFPKLAIFQPGMIVGNAHTPAWVTWFTRLIPDSLGWGNIALTDLAKAFAAHLEKRAPAQTQPVVCYGNREMKALIRD